MNITVFLGSNPGTNEKYARLAAEVGRMIAEGGHTLVYGGATNGLMGILARNVRDHGGHILGVIPGFFHEVQNTDVDELVVVQNMQERKKLLMDRGSMYIALPGGIGTLEEMADAISALKLKHHHNLCIFMNLDGYYEPLKAMLQKMYDEGFADPASLEGVLFLDHAEDLGRYL